MKSERRVIVTQAPDHPLTGHLVRTESYLGPTGMALAQLVSTDMKLNHLSIRSGIRVELDDYEGLKQAPPLKSIVIVEQPSNTNSPPKAQKVAVGVACRRQSRKTSSEEEMNSGQWNLAVEERPPPWIEKSCDQTGSALGLSSRVVLAKGPELLSHLDPTELIDFNTRWLPNADRFLFINHPRMKNEHAAVLVESIDLD